MELRDKDLLPDQPAQENDSHESATRDLIWADLFDDGPYSARGFGYQSYRPDPGNRLTGNDSLSNLPPWFAEQYRARGDSFNNGNNSHSNAPEADRNPWMRPGAHMPDYVERGQANVQIDRRVGPGPNGVPGRPPEGYTTLKGSISPQVTAMARSLLSGEYGTMTPFTANGKSYMARVEPHYRPPGSQSAGPKGWHKGVTVYEAL